MVSGDRAVARCWPVEPVLLAAGLITACGGDSEGGVDDPDTEPDTAGPSLVAFFDANASIVAGSPQRLTFGVGDANGALVPDSAAELSMTVRDPTGKVVGPAQTVPLHAEGLPAGTTRSRSPRRSPAPTRWRRRSTAGKATASFTAGTLDTVRVPGAGATMPDLHTPTTADARGVDPICTAEPACPLHAVDLADARTQGKPIALLVSTPAYCQLAICGPVLDVLLDARDAVRRIADEHPRRGVPERRRGRARPVAGGPRSRGRGAEPRLRALPVPDRGRREHREAPRHDLRCGRNSTGADRARDMSAWREVPE